jgi:hypothetical protein
VAARNRGRRLQSIKQMREAGLRITVNTDDPAMFGADIAQAHHLLFAGPYRRPTSHALR